MIPGDAAGALGFAGAVLERVDGPGCDTAGVPRRSTRSSSGISAPARCTRDRFGAAACFVTAHERLQVTDLSGFGVDADGETYLLDVDAGTVDAIVPRP